MNLGDNLVESEKSPGNLSCQNTQIDYLVLNGNIENIRLCLYDKSIKET